MNSNILKMFMVLFLSILLSCSEEKQPNILAKIGDLEITIDEFLNRSELTPRPFYCRSDSDRDKIIILNTLLIEKLFALEERGESTLLDKPIFKALIQGRKEQYIREELFNRMTVSENDLDSVEISNALKLSGFVYDVEFVRLNTELANALQKKMQANPEMRDSLFNTFSQFENTPRHQVRFKDPEFPSLHHAMYGQEWKKGEIIGPIRLRETKYMVLKIENVFYNPVMSQTEFVDRRKRVKEKLIEKHTNKAWNQYTARLMKGKKVQFIPDITKKVAELWSKNFNKDDGVLKIKGDSDKQYGQFVKEIELLSEETMFKVNNDIWTVADFKYSLLSHPLVFRKADLTPSDFLPQFRLAVADLVKDTFITKEAYDQNIDKLKKIQRKVAMWEDAYLALEHRNKFIASERDNNDTSEESKNFHTLINGYIIRLKNKYEGQIEVNVNLLEKIKITHTDFVTVQQFVPFQQNVPMFPLLTRDDQLEIGSLLNKL